MQTLGPDGSTPVSIRTFSSCEGPNDVGRVTTVSNYELPPVPEDPQTLYVEIISLNSDRGSYLHETLRNEDGEIVAYRSGVAVPVEE